MIGVEGDRRLEEEGLLSCAQQYAHLSANCTRREGKHVRILKMKGGQAGEAVQGWFKAPTPYTVCTPVRLLTVAVSGCLLEAAAAQQLTYC